MNTLYTPDAGGGAERFMQTLSEGIVKAGHRAVVLTTSQRKGVHTSHANGVKVYHVGLKNLYWPFRGKKNPTALKPLVHALDVHNIWMAREVARILDAERPDVVHTNMLWGFSVLAWQRIKQRRIPLVHTLHDHYLLCPRGIMFRDGKNCEGRCADCLPFALLKQRASNRVDAVVGVSRFILERHLEFGYFAATPKKAVIANPYGTASIPPPKERSSIRFGYLGNLIAPKGIEALLRVTERLPEGGWSLDIGGRGAVAAYEQSLRSRYEKPPTIVFRGYVKPEAFFSDIDVLVVPSLLREPFGRVVIEAYAHGVPVIGSDRGGIPEMIEDGNTGFLFDPDIPGSLSNAMRKCLENPAMIGAMRHSCLKKSADFLPEEIVARHLELYAEVGEEVRRSGTRRG